MIVSTIARRTVDCIILFGQSNEEGGILAGTPSSTYLGPQLNTKIFYKPDDPGATNNGLWQNYQYGLNNNWRATGLSYNGPDISLGKQYFAQTGKELWILKYAYSGSGLVDTGSPYVNGLWQWDANPANVNGLPHYTNAVNNFIIPAINRAKANGIDLNIKAMHWCQGETEAGNAAGGYLTYQPVLISMINKLISDLTPYNVMATTFKPIITRIHNHFSPARPYQNEVRTALVNVANYFSGPWIDSDGYSLGADNIHWDRPAQEQHGIDIATKLISL